MASFPALDTPPLRLEPVSVEHAEEMHAVLADPSIYEFLNEEEPPTLEWLREAYARRSKGQSPDGDELWFNWMIRRDDGRLIGYVQATLEEPGACWIAYVLAADGRGQGHASRAVTAMIDHLRCTHGVRRLLASVEQGNERSIGLLMRLGFVDADPELHRRFKIEACDRLYVRPLTST